MHAISFMDVKWLLIYSLLSIEMKLEFIVEIQLRIKDFVCVLRCVHEIISWVELE